MCHLCIFLTPYLHLQAELAAVRDRYEAAATDAQSGRREVDQLRTALGTLDARLVEYQQNDAEVCSVGEVSRSFCKRTGAREV